MFPINRMWMKQQRLKLGRPGKIALTTCILALVAFGGYVRYRRHVLYRLYLTAEGYPGYSRDSDESTAAAKALATYRGQWSSDLLLAIATRSGSPLAGEAEEVAIRALAARHDPRAGVELAPLLQPQTTPTSRLAVASALMELPCNEECVGSILHYLERIWWGELNWEQRWKDPLKGGQEPGVAEKARQVYADLYSVLRRENSETLTIMANVYDIGGTEPSPFALDLLSKLGMREACPLLLQSAHQLGAIQPDFFEAPRKQLQATIKALKCR